MKHAYRCARPLLAALFLLLGQRAVAQQFWRPFRPGLIYSYKELSGPSSNLAYTLRVDSAYATSSGDSVYAFNRLLRVASTTLPGSVKSRNNLFGATLRWRPGQPGYLLEAQAQPNVQTAVSLPLYPRAAIGSSWSITQPQGTATLVSRSWQTISPGVQDTVSVISIASGASTTTVRLSRAHGLLAGPQWLGGSAGSQLEQAALPATFETSLYNPLRFFGVQPGDEFGYQQYDIGINPITCYDDRALRRILNKRLTADSLIITYQEQTRHENFGYNGYCPTPASVAYSPIVVKRWALALAGNQWLPAPASIAQFAALRLLTGEYKEASGGSAGLASNLLTGLPIDLGTGSGCNTFPRIRYTPYYPQAGSPTYRTGLDLAGWQYSFGQGVTTTAEGFSFLVQVYYRKNVNGVIQTCGSPTSFVDLLATHAAQAAEVATLAPNPATEAATLTLAQPARPGTVLRLTDALGREVWRAAVPAGQAAVAVPLAGQPAGLYLLRMSGQNAPAATWKLVRE